VLSLPAVPSRCLYRVVRLRLEQWSNEIYLLPFTPIIIIIIIIIIGGAVLSP
jgi:hypothetical protein